MKRFRSLTNDEFGQGNSSYKGNKVESFIHCFRNRQRKDTAAFSDYMRMPYPKFVALAELIGPYIKKDTIMRMSLPRSERLALTICFLATGENLASVNLK